jgi:hypothetical protein
MFSFFAKVVKVDPTFSNEFQRLLLFYFLRYFFDCNQEVGITTAFFSPILPNLY